MKTDPKDRQRMISNVSFIVLLRCEKAGLPSEVMTDMQAVRHTANQKSSDFRDVPIDN